MRKNMAIQMAAALMLAAAMPAMGQEKESVALTVYNGGYAVVREVRRLDIAKDGQVKFKDVASRIDATTVHFKSLTDPDAKLLEQNYQYDLVSADKLLKKYIDRTIEVICEDLKYDGRLLSFDRGQLVLHQEVAGDIVMVQRPDRHPLFGPAGGSVDPADAGVAGGHRQVRGAPGRGDLPDRRHGLARRVCAGAGRRRHGRRPVGLGQRAEQLRQDLQ
jgi:hypothetical protein